jgi:CubicO group peptidase (beta-lactamase class C family)
MWWVWDGPRNTGYFKGAYIADGAHGQKLLVLPELDMVVAQKRHANTVGSQFYDIPYANSSFHNFMELLVSLKDSDGSANPPMALLPEEVLGQPTKAELTEAVRQLGTQYSVPVTQVGFRTPERRVFLEAQSFGSDAILPGETMIYQAASISKAFFSYIVMRLVDKGVIDLDKPLYEYTDNIVPPRFHDAIAGNPTASAQNAEWAKLITARICLTHASGLPNWASSLGQPSNEKLVMQFQPGTNYRYSGEGIQYLQEVLEHITGKGLEQLAKEEVYGPFKLEHSSFEWRDSYELLAVWGYQENNTRYSSRNVTREASSAFSLRTNVREFSVFMERAVMNGEGLKPETYQDWITPHRNIGVEGGYTGLGIRVYYPNTTDESGFRLGHGGSNGGFRCNFWVWPKQKTYLVYFTNSNNGAILSEPIRTLLLPNFPL